MSELGENVVAGLYRVILFLWHWTCVIGEYVVACLYRVILFLLYWTFVYEE